jgi:Lon protease-like protein
MMKKVLEEGSDRTFGYVKSKVPPSDKNYGKLLKTEWNGEETGTLAHIVNTQQEPGTNHILMDVVGTQRFKIIDRERTLYGYWTGKGTLGLID